MLGYDGQFARVFIIQHSNLKLRWMFGKTSNTVQTSMRAKSQVQDERTEGCAMSIRQYKANQLRRLEFAYVWFLTTIFDHGWFSQ